MEGREQDSPAMPIMPPQYTPVSSMESQGKQRQREWSISRELQGWFREAVFLRGDGQRLNLSVCIVLRNHAFEAKAACIMVCAKSSHKA